MLKGIRNDEHVIVKTPERSYDRSLPDDVIVSSLSMV